MPSPKSDRYFRVDPHHETLELMQKAVAHLQLSDFQLQLREHTIHLSGSVQSWSEKQSAQECIRSLAGSRRIENDLDVAAF